MKSSITHVIYTPRPNTSAEAEVDMLAAIYKFILFDSQAKRGDQHDLTENPTPKTTTNGSRTKEQEKTQRGETSGSRI